jgi:hypothetical protein
MVFRVRGFSAFALASAAPFEFGACLLCSAEAAPTAPTEPPGTQTAHRRQRAEGRTDRGIRRKQRGGGRRHRGTGTRQGQTGGVESRGPRLCLSGCVRALMLSVRLPCHSVSQCISWCRARWRPLLPSLPPPPPPPPRCNSPSVNRRASVVLTMLPLCCRCSHTNSNNRMSPHPLHTRLPV